MDAKPRAWSSYIVWRMGSKGFWEWYLGHPPTGAGEATQWRWSWQPPWPIEWPAWLGSLVAVGLLAAIVWSYRRESSILSRPQRLALTGLRLTAIVVAGLLWMQPTLIIARSGLPPVAVLFDTSASMASQDATLKMVSPGAERRWDQVLTVVSDNNGRFFRALAAEHPLRVFQFGGSAVSISSDPDKTDTAGVLAAVQQLQPDELQTRPAEAVRQVFAELRGAPPAAMVIFTDGIASESDNDKLSQVADLIRRRGTELFLVPVGSDEPRRDLELFDVVMDDVAFVGDPVVIAGKVRGTGVDLPRITVEARIEGADRTLAEQPIALRKDDQGTRFELLFTPETAGDLSLEIAVPPIEGEVDRDNNHEVRALSVRDEKLKVLLVESAPRYEFRYLKQWLERDKSIALQTLLIDGDPDYAREDRTAIAYFPVQKDELSKFDVVILGDVSPSQLGSTAADWLESYVRNQGGGLLLIAGVRKNPQSFAGTALSGLLPFSLDSVDAATWEQAVSVDFHPQLTLDGQKGVPMFRLAVTEAENQTVWNALPPLYGLLTIRDHKPGARVLVEHPTLKGRTDRLPVILMQQVGAGKVLFHATDELWRWRFRTGDTYYGRYWSQAIRYLSRGRLLGQDRTAELVVDRQTFQQGEPVLLRVRFLDDRLTPARDDAVRVVVELPDEGRREVTLHRLPYLPSVFESTLTGLSAGAYHVWLASPSSEKAPPAVDFRVESLHRELQRRAVDRADLDLTARKARGTIVPLSEVGGLPNRIPVGRVIPLEQGRPLPLWSRFEPLALLMTLLIAEWVLRRRWRLV
jgi:hypothetical protein